MNGQLFGRRRRELRAMTSFFGPSRYLARPRALQHMKVWTTFHRSHQPGTIGTLVHCRHRSINSTLSHTSGRFNQPQCCALSSAALHGASPALPRRPLVQLSHLPSSRELSHKHHEPPLPSSQQHLHVLMDPAKSSPPSSRAKSTLKHKNPIPRLVQTPMSNLSRPRTPSGRFRIEQESRTSI